MLSRGKINLLVLGVLAHITYNHSAHATTVFDSKQLDSLDTQVVGNVSTGSYPIISAAAGDSVLIEAPSYTWDLSTYTCANKPACQTSDIIYSVYANANSAITLQGSINSPLTITNTGTPIRTQMKLDIGKTNGASSTYLALDHVNYINDLSDSPAIYENSKLNGYKTNPIIDHYNISITNSSIISKSRALAIGQSDVYIANSTLIGNTHGVLLGDRNARVVADHVVIEGGVAAIAITESGSPGSIGGNFGTVNISNGSVLRNTSATSSTSQYVIYIATGNYDAATFSYRQIQKLHLDNVLLEAYGTNISGIFSQYYDSYLNNVTLTIKGNSGVGVLHSNNGLFELYNSSLTTQGTNGYGILMQMTSTETTGTKRGTTSVSVEDTNIYTLGYKSHAIVLNPTYISNIAYLKYTQNGGAINTKGDVAMLIYSSLGSLVNLSNIKGLTEGVGSDAIYLIANKDKNDSNQNIIHQVNLTSSSITSEQGNGITILGGTRSNITLDSSQVKSLGKNGASQVSFASRASSNGLQARDINLTLTNNSELLGHVWLSDASQLSLMSLDQSSLTGNILLGGSSRFDTLTLKNNSRWVGATYVNETATAIQYASLDATSQWFLNGNKTSTVTQLTNFGKIVFSNPNSPQILQVNGDYIGGGSFTMTGNYRSNNDDSTVDQLVIHGDVTGQTSIIFISNDNIGAQTTGDGIKVVQVMGNSLPNSFIQQGKLTAGLYEYTLRAGTATGVFDGSWYLSSEFTDNPDPVIPVNPVEPPPIIDPVGPPPIIEPILPPITSPQNYRPEVITSSIIPALSYALADTQLATYQERIAGTDNNLTNKAAWFRYTHQNATITYKSGFSASSKAQTFESYGANYERSINGVQIGYDLLINDPIHSRLLSRPGMERAGVYVGLASAQADVNHIYTPKQAGRVSIDSMTLGSYYTLQADNGFYTDNIAALNVFYTIRNTSDSANAPSATHAYGLNVSSELGYKYNIDNKLFIEPQAQLSLQYIKFNDLAITHDALLRFGTAKAWNTRLGLRVGYKLDDEPQNIAYARVNLIHTEHNKVDLFYSTPNIENSTIHNRSALYGSWINLDLGINRSLSKLSYGYLAVSYAKGLQTSTGHATSIKFGVTSKF